MKIKLLLCLLGLLLVSPIVEANPILILGTPTNATGGGTRPSPALGGALVNFDGLTPFSTFSSYSNQGVTISSPDGFMVLPFSTESAPNELFDNSSFGSANININLATGSYGVGVGIADSDSPVTILLQALNSMGLPFGSAFSITIPESNPDTAGNGYFVLEDNIADIYGLNITASTTNQSGLAIDDIQVTPEPSTIVLMLSGILFIVITRKRLTVF